MAQPKRELLTKEYLEEDDTPKEKPRGRPKGSKSMRGTYAKMTLAKKKQIIKLLAKNGGNQRAAAAACGVSHQTIVYHKKHDPVFAEKVEEAINLAKHEVDTEIRRRGIDGYEKPVYYQGELVGYETVYSDTLLMERARALMPEKYSKRSQVDINQNITVEHKAKEKLAQLLDAELIDDTYEVTDAQLINDS